MTQPLDHSMHRPPRLDRTQLHSLELFFDSSPIHTGHCRSVEFSTETLSIPSIEWILLHSSPYFTHPFDRNVPRLWSLSRPISVSCYLSSDTQVIPFWWSIRLFLGGDPPEAVPSAPRQQRSKSTCDCRVYCLNAI